MTCLLVNRCCLRTRCRLLVRCCLGWTILVLAATLLSAQMSQPSEIVNFRLEKKYLIIVRTMVNGFGPYDFLLDTGTSRTVIDPQLAYHVRVPVIGEATLSLASGDRQVDLAQLDEVRVGRTAASGLGVMVDKLEQVKRLAPSIRGVLGEDFLSRFDILIDYSQQWLRFGEAEVIGERCQFQTGSQYRGMITTNRLLVPVEIAEIGHEKLALQLDTGASVSEVFFSSSTAIVSLPWGGAQTASLSTNGRMIHPHVTLKIGTTTVKNQNVMQDRRNAAFDSAGLLSAAIFRRIYISHSGRYVVLNPVSLPASREEVAIQGQAESTPMALPGY